MTCVRCGASIGDDPDGDVLMVYSNTDEEVRRTGEFGDLVGVYCEKCTAAIEEAPELHDEQVDEFKRELDEHGGQE